MNWLKRLFGGPAEPEASQQGEEAVLVHLQGSGLPDHIYEEYDLSTLEDRLLQVIDRESLGEFDGNELGATEAVLNMYGPNAELLFAGIESVLRDYPLCQGARVVIRQGGPGAIEREVYL